MKVIQGIIEKGEVILNRPVPADDGTTVFVFIMPKIVESDSSED